MCKLGCDDLYEKGFISVKEGHVVLNPKWPVTDDLKLLTQELEGNRVDNWNESETYYRGHMILHFGKKHV